MQCYVKTSSCEVKQTNAFSELENYQSLTLFEFIHTMDDLSVLTVTPNGPSTFKTIWRDGL